MKNIIFLANLFLTNILLSQMVSNTIQISQTYSSNGQFVLQSFSYDNEIPNIKGESFVCHNQGGIEGFSTKKIFYKINRSFDIYEGYPFFVAISNDGRKIIYIKNEVYYNGEEHKNVTYYVDGKLTKTYTTEEFTECKNPSGLV